MTDQPALFRPTAAEGAAAERAELIATLGRHESVLDGVDAAIERLEAGTYGRCSTCGEAIDDALLDEDPLVLGCGGATCRPTSMAPTAP